MSKAPWKVLQTEEVLKVNWFRLRVERCELPDGRVMPRYYTMEFPHWVNVVALTEKNEMIFVRQYRQSRGVYTLEIPGGGSHGGGAEDLLTAAQRELREETGYASKEWSLVGTHAPNPALQNNLMYTYVAKNCFVEGEPTPDPFEDLETLFYSKDDVMKLLREGAIDHSIVIASLALYFLKGEEGMGKA